MEESTDRAELFSPEDDRDRISQNSLNMIECPHCYTQVAVMADGTCPSCRKNVNDTEGTNPDMTADWRQLEFPGDDN
jgi:hypothetical protein